MFPSEWSTCRFKKGQVVYIDPAAVTSGFVTPEELESAKTNGVVVEMIYLMLDGGKQFKMSLTGIARDVPEKFLSDAPVKTSLPIAPLGPTSSIPARRRLRL